MKKIVSLILCLMLMLSMTTTAFAAVEVDNKTGRDYKAYQIFKGTEVAGTMTFTDWGTGVDSAKLLTELKGGTYGSVFSSCATAADVAHVMLQYPDNDPVARYFANCAARCIQGAGTPIPGADTSATLDAGYYVLIDQKEVDGENDTKNAALLQVTNKGKITMSMKVEVPIHEKNILGTDDLGGHNHTTVEDYAIGDEVEFHLRAELPVNVKDFDEYRMVFHDAMSDGLTFVNDPAKYAITVTYEKYDAGTGTYVSTTITLDQSHYEVLSGAALGTCSTGKACDVHFVIDDVFDFLTPTEADDAVFVLSYKAVLNDNALIGSPNLNEYALEFSNDPNWEPPTTDAVPPTGITPWDEVQVYSTDIKILKIDGLTGDPLTGAEFTLTGTKTNRVKTSGTWFEKYPDSSYEAGNKYWLLNDNTYTNVDPATPGIDLSKYKDTTTVYKMVTETKFIQTATDVTAKAYVDKYGKLTFGGLAEGTYTITESVVPTGYNATEPVKLTIVFDEKTSTYTYQWDGGNSHSNNTVTIANYSGSQLPETGGIGTTMFYIIGGLLFAASAVLLVTKKRMIAE